MQIVAMSLFSLSARRLGRIPLFAAGRSWTVDDAIALAVFRGELDRAVEETLALAAAEERAAEESLEISDQSLQASSESFRYEHDLISAGETEEWLSARGMTTDDFGRWLYQRLCRDAYPPASHTAPPAIPDDFADLLRVHLQLSGEMDLFAEQLRRGVAADRELAAAGAEREVGGALAAFLERERLDRGALAGWLSAAGRDERWLEEIARIEAAFERLSAAPLTEAARARKLAAMQRSLSRVEFDLLDVDSPGAAREALLCVRDDGVPLAEVAREAGFRVLRRQASVEDLGPLAERLFSAAEGDVVGPLESEGRFRLYHVLRKDSPSLSDAAVARRIDTLILDDFFTELTARHVESPGADIP